MSIENGRTYQSSRMWHKGKEHKDIYFNNNFHHNIVIPGDSYDFDEDNTDKLGWHKGFDDDYMIFQAGVLYPKHKIYWSAGRTVGTSKRYKNVYTPFHCGDYAFATAGGKNLYRVSKDGRVFYTDPSLGTLMYTFDTLSFGSSTVNYSGNEGEFKTYVSCQYGFLYGSDYMHVYFQQITADGELGNTLVIYEHDSHNGIYLMGAFVLNDYIYKAVCETVDGTSGVTLEKISPQDGSIISTIHHDYDYVLRPGSSGYWKKYNESCEEFFIVNGHIYFCLDWDDPNSTGSSNWKSKIKIYDENFNLLTFFSFNTTSRSIKLLYFKGNYYFYAFINSAGWTSMTDEVFQIYKGSSVSALSLIKTYTSDERFIVLPEIAMLDGGSESHSEIYRRFNIWYNIVSAFHYRPAPVNYYKNRRFHNVDENGEYLIFYSTHYITYGEGYDFYFFDNAELELTDNCFVIFGATTSDYSYSTNTQIWDKYYRTQQGGE